jgi:predicted ATP-dependent endonuclease of OLD family
MKLISVQVKKFRNILDSTIVSIQDDITCLVGKNESGKTTFMGALWRLHTTQPNADFDIQSHYPAWLEKSDKLRGENLEEVVPISAIYKLSPEEVSEITSRFGSVIISDEIELSRNYKGTMFYSVKTDEAKFIKHFIGKLKTPTDMKDKLKGISQLKELKEFIKELDKSEVEGAAESKANAEKLLKEVLGESTGDDINKVIWDFIKQNYLPVFFYYHQYSALPYSVDIKKILSTNLSNLSNGEVTARIFLRLAAADDNFLLNADYEKRKRELENIANAITSDVLKYWSQNKQLRVMPDITQKTQNNQNGQTSVIDELKIRVWDDRHSLSLAINEHSTGFQWFFSFLVAFSEYEMNRRPVVILLDEPALGLHAKAQADFLKFIEERLAVNWQVVYTTHSPFMVQPDHLERVRLVEDKGKETGAIISSDVMSTDPDTLFPLQGALGYDIAQHLFISPHNLVVEGLSDYTYLSLVSTFLSSKEGKKTLDSKWSIVPVGGADSIPTFVALLGNHLDVTVLVDSGKGGNQRLLTMANKGILSKNKILNVGEIIKRKLGDIEDLFDVKDYLEIFNRAFTKTVKPADLNVNEPIVNQLARILGVDRYDHGLPADILLKHRDELLPTFSDKTFENFERLFESVNKTLGA